MKPRLPRLTPAQRQVLGERLARRAQALRAEISAAAERDAGELCEIEAALERMEADTYGLCTDCDSALPWARLDAVPEAPRCVRCERARQERELAHATL